MGASPTKPTMRECVPKRSVPKRIRAFVWKHRCASHRIREEQKRRSGIVGSRKDTDAIPRFCLRISVKARKRAFQP
jgi:hypothetical protein